jgi:hypothetical protein
MICDRARLQPVVYFVRVVGMHWLHLEGRRRALNWLVIKYNYFAYIFLLPVMHIICSMCRILFDAASDVFVTSCGHLFHCACLIQWIER